jgi:hypothetical protein
MSYQIPSIKIDIPSPVLLETATERGKFPPEFTGSPTCWISVGSLGPISNVETESEPAYICKVVKQAHANDVAYTYVDIVQPITANGNAPLRDEAI